MAGSGTVTVNIIGNADKLNSAMDGVAGKLSSFGDKATDVGKKMTIGLTAPILAGFGASAKAASDFNESLSKVNTVFGEQGKAIEEWANGTAKSLGISKREAVDTAGSFGNMFTQIGIGAPKAAEMSQAMITLAADLGSFHNADITEVIQAQTSAFRGEYDSLQKFIPTINAATVEQEALRATGKSTTAELTAQEKALATQTLIMNGAGAAAGDFTRTQDGMANQLKISKAEADNATVSLGQALGPVTEKVTGLVAGLADKFAGLSSGQQTAIVVIGLVAAALGPLIALIGTLSTVMAFLAANPIVLVIAAIAALAVGLVVAYQKVEWFRNIVQSVFGWIKDHWPLLAPLFGPIGIAIAVLVTQFDNIKGAVQGVWNFIRPILEKIGDAVGKVAGPLGALAGAAGKVGGAIGGTIGKLFHAGGVIPGPRGQNVAIMAQAGERILPMGAAGSSGGPINIQMVIDGRVLGEISAASLRDLQDRSGNLGIEAA